MGIAFSIYANCIVPAISLVVKKKITGTAFGIMQMIESIALASFPLINGSLIDHGESNHDTVKGYHASSLFFFLVGFVAMLVSIGLFFIPDKFKRKLDSSSQVKMKL